MFMKKNFYVIAILTCGLISCDKYSSGNKNIIPADIEQNVNSHSQSNDSLKKSSIVIDSLKSESTKDSLTKKNLTQDSLHPTKTVIKKR